MQTDFGLFEKTFKINSEEKLALVDFLYCFRECWYFLKLNLHTWFKILTQWSEVRLWSMSSDTHDDFFLSCWQLVKEYSFLDFIFGGMQVNFTVSVSHLACTASLA